eukprot:6113535-Pyramimonas_sp.AAC.1
MEYETDAMETEANSMRVRCNKTTNPFTHLRTYPLNSKDKLNHSVHIDLRLSLGSLHRRDRRRRSMMEENRKLRDEFAKLSAVKVAVAERLAAALGHLDTHKKAAEAEQAAKDKAARE